MLLPFSIGSFVARRPALILARATSAEWVIVVSILLIGAGHVLFLVDRSGYLPVVTSMLLTGIGVGAVFAVNPIQIVDGVPADQTGSGISFYQLVKTVGYSVASTVSVIVLLGLLYPPRRTATHHCRL